MMINDKMLKSSFTEEQEMIEKVLSFLENREDHYLPIERDFLYIIDDRQRVRFDLFCRKDVHLSVIMVKPRLN